MKYIVIIGGGAAGLISAITAKTSTNKVTILEKNATCGKKILATGNGKCNYWNSDQNLLHYNSSNQELLSQLITPLIQQEALAFFSNLGIVPKIKNGYYYPFSNQAITIKNALLNEIAKKDIEIRTDFAVEKIKKEEECLAIYSTNEKIIADKVIVATGSKASPKTGSTGDGYKILTKLGHQIIPPHPALVQLKTEGDYLKRWSGIRTDVKISLYENGTLLKEETGEIQLTDYGVSGICVFNLSRHVSIGLSKNKKEEVSINFLPFISESPQEFLAKQFANKNSIKTQLEGILNSKLVDIILEISSINKNKTYNELTSSEKEILVSSLVSFKTKIIGTNSFDQAQVCSGGIPLTEINLETMESKIVKNLYIVGELLDVDGDCGGYNLGFAWMSGIKAGKGCNIND